MADLKDTVFKYLIPTDQLTVAKQEMLRQQAAVAALNRALATHVVASPAEALIRDADIVADFGCGVGGWLTMPLAVVGNPYSVFATAVPAALTPQLANNRVAVFYSCWVETPAFPVDQLSFREGATAGSTYAVFGLEVLTTCINGIGWFSEPIYYDPLRVINVVVRARIATGVQARVGLGCFVVEPKGPTVSS